VDLLQKMIFPKLNRDPTIDSFIKKCWHNEYSTIAELVAETEKLCDASNEASDRASQS
jgi:hypothetical protein